MAVEAFLTPDPHAFAVGDTVRFKTGNVAMTVIALLDGYITPSVRCGWFDRHAVYHSGIFQESVLVALDDTIDTTEFS